ncbi:MAG: Rab family GTPase [Thermoplasmata archaeon]
MPGKERIKIKVCLVGDSAVGKTSLIRRFVHDEFDDRYVTTLGAKVSKKDIVVRVAEGKRLYVDMTIWDIMGEKSFLDLLKDVYFHGAKGILTVCDVTRRDTLYGLPDWVDAVQKITGDIPMYVLANKVDLKDQISFDEQELRELAGKYDSPYSYTSARTGENVQEAFQQLAGLICQMIAPLP